MMYITHRLPHLPTHQEHLITNRPRTLFQVLDFVPSDFEFLVFDLAAMEDLAAALRRR
jgi:hypothetical protein